MSRKFDRDKWLDERGKLKGFGSSEAPAVCGEDPYRSAAELYYEKTGELSEIEEDSDAIIWGRISEPATAKFYQEKTGNVVRKVHRIIHHPKYPFMFASLDYESGNICVEVKSTNRWLGLKDWGKPGTDEVPFPVALQVQHQMSVTGKREAHIPVTIGGGVPRIYRVKFSARIESMLIELEEDLFQRICRHEPPPLDFSHPTTHKLVKSLYGVAEGKEIELNDEVEFLVNRYTGFTQMRADAQKERDQLEAQILAAMADAAIAHLPDGRTLIRKEIERKGYEVKPCTYISLSIKQPKESKHGNERIREIEARS